MIDFTALKNLATKFTVTGAQKAHIDRLIFELGVQEKEAIKALERISTLETENAELKSKLDRIERAEEIPGERCPYCRRNTGRLLDIKPKPNFAHFGIKQGYYKCDEPSCGREFDKEMPEH
jgi:tRNA U34 2-thiouridine synthase MnmA/TrmU